MSHLDKKKAKEEEKKREEIKKKNEMCKILEQELWTNLKIFNDTSKNRTSIKAFAKVLLGKETKEEPVKRGKLVGFK